MQRAHVYASKQMCTRACATSRRVFVRIYRYKYSCTCTGTYTCICTYTRACTHAHAHAHTHTRRNTHTHTHTHTQRYDDIHACGEIIHSCLYSDNTYTQSQFVARQCMIGYCYIIRDFSSLMTRDLNVTYIENFEDPPVSTYT
jgi:hypothetical protein